MAKKYTLQTKEELENLLFKETWEKDSISFKETDIKLSDIDTRYITNMSGLFSASKKRTDFSGIESWDTSNVENMSSMFAFVENFNADISSWNVSKVKNMAHMFFCSPNFNQPLDKWDTSNVEDMAHMFENATAFNQNLDSWDVSKVKDFDEMFEGSLLQNNPPKWYKH